MFKMHDVLIPGRFFCFILQLLLTISAGFGYKDFVLAIVSDENDEDYNKVVTIGFLRKEKTNRLISLKAQIKG